MVFYFFIGDSRIFFIGGGGGCSFLWNFPHHFLGVTFSDQGGCKPAPPLNPSIFLYDFIVLDCMWSKKDWMIYTTICLHTKYRSSVSLSVHLYTYKAPYGTIWSTSIRDRTCILGMHNPSIKTFSMLPLDDIDLVKGSELRPLLETTFFWICIFKHNITLCK